VKGWFFLLPVKSAVEAVFRCFVRYVVIFAIFIVKYVFLN